MVVRRHKSIHVKLKQMTDSQPEFLVRTMPWDEFQAYHDPFDKRLPPDATHNLFEAQLTEMQSRFRRFASDIGIEGEDWELPPHYQDALVFYVYVNDAKMYTPKLVYALSEAMAGFDEMWLAELECFNPPLKPGGVTFLAYHKGYLLASNGHESLALVEQLTEDSRRTKR
jgi:hypothetical protein